MTHYNLNFGSSSKRTNWGLSSKVKGMYSGGYSYYVYGIKGIISFEKLECWGIFKDMKL